MNNRTLAIIFFALLGVYLLTRLLSARPETTFRTDLVQVDTSLVDKIELHPKSEEGQIVTLQRNNGQWTVSNGDLTAPALTNAVGSLLGQLNLMKAKRVVAKQAEKWKDYEVDEESGARVTAYADGNVLTDFIVGRFNFNQQTRQATSYLRLTEEEEVYAVDGFLSMTFGQDINAFRNKQILKLNTGEEVNSLQLQSGAETVNLQKQNGGWLLNNEQVIDSTEMAAYLAGLRYVAGNTFADDFNSGAGPDQSLQLQVNNLPITINAYPYTGGDKDFVIQSSQYPEAFFASDSSGIYAKLFVDLIEVTRGVQE